MWIGIQKQMKRIIFAGKFTEPLLCIMYHIIPCPYYLLYLLIVTSTDFERSLSLGSYQFQCTTWYACMMSRLARLYFPGQNCCVLVQSLVVSPNGIVKRWVYCLCWFWHHMKRKVQLPDRLLTCYHAKAKRRCVHLGTHLSPHKLGKQERFQWSTHLAQCCELRSLFVCQGLASSLPAFPRCNDHLMIRVFKYGCDNFWNLDTDQAASTKTLWGCLKSRFSRMSFTEQRWASIFSALLRDNPSIAILYANLMRFFDRILKKPVAHLGFLSWLCYCDLCLLMYATHGETGPLPPGFWTSKCPQPRKMRASLQHEFVSKKTGKSYRDGRLSSELCT